MTRPMRVSVDIGIYTVLLSSRKYAVTINQWEMKWVVDTTRRQRLSFDEWGYADNLPPYGKDPLVEAKPFQRRADALDYYGERQREVAAALAAAMLGITTP